MSVDTRREITITNAGYNDTIAMANYPGITRVDLAGGFSLAGNVDLGNTSEMPPDGFATVYIVTGQAGAALNGFYFRINGVDILESQLQAGILFYNTGNGVDWDMPIIVMSSDSSAPAKNTSGEWIIDETITLAKLEDLASAKIIVGDGTNRPAAVSVTGDVTLSNAGVTAIGSDKITNAMVKSNAAIARTKLASGTASQVVINDGSGVMSSEAQLSPSRGGNGQDFSAANGFQVWTAGVASATAISDVLTIDVSFESGEQGDFKVKLPYSCTVTEIYAYAVKAIAGTDSGTIVPKNNAGTTMTGGTITYAASDPRGTAYTSTPSANNTFSSGEYLTLTTAKTTAGGKVMLSIKVTRLA